MKQRETNSVESSSSSMKKFVSEQFGDTPKYIESINSSGKSIHKGILLLI